MNDQYTADEVDALVAKNERPDERLLGVDASLEPTAHESGGVTAKGIQILPLGDRLVVRPDTSETEVKAGAFQVLLPETAQEKPMRGVVLATGEGRTLADGTLVKSKIKVGDKVIYSRYAGSIVKDDKEDFLIIGEKDVLAIALPAAPSSPL